jgi:hypothetical protein
MFFFKAANGHVDCLKILKEYGAKYVANMEGNYPLHWAAQNGKSEAVKFLIEAYDVDVLIQNSFGRSILTEAFQSQNSDVIELCLSHSSATEEKLTATNNNTRPVTTENSNSKNSNETDVQINQDAIFHHMSFTSQSYPNVRWKDVKIRELPITRADNPFGSNMSPEDDTTGLGIWPASIVCARWVLSNRYSWLHFDKINHRIKFTVIFF